MAWVGAATLYDIVYRVLGLDGKIDENLNNQLVVNNNEQINETNKRPTNLKKPSEPFWHKFLIESSFYTNTIKIFNTEGETGNKITVCLGFYLYFF